MTSVILSLGGVFLGLSFLELPFGIIMTGVGVISLAGVVVNNAIVLIDYTNRLLERGMHFKEAIIAAGCTRLRPVLLTAATTILGLLPMVTGIAYNFHEMKVSTVSESSQWWSSMASAVIFGLALATVLTLVVVPTLYSLVYTASRASGRGVKYIRRAYWAPFYHFTNTKPEEEEQ
jgi:multidrug efflux pump